uniref:Guanine nucleotide-binding protein subunit beta-like protein (Cytoplasmic antigenic protein 1) n=1 Tax=Ganoderma boninense TaxID=34458 RepID=A0A5K1JWD0_9APHY|nr:Guanine nucleotide-binding protein subunit beta-like protein (Cytoplasmic antigenic protein 1) [Ganoderma boninense]
MTRRYTETARLTEGHTAQGITCVEFNPDGTLLATGGMDGRLCIWDAEQGRLLHQYITLSAVPITSLGWIDAERPTVMVGNKSGNLVIVVVNQTDLSSSGFWAHRYPVECLAIQDDLVASGACSELKVWKRDADHTYKWTALIQEPPLESIDGQEIIVTGIQWIPSDKYGRLLIAAYMFHGVQMLETVTWAQVRHIPIKGKIASASVSEDGTRIAISNLTTGFNIYLLKTGELLHSFEHNVGDCLPTPVRFIHAGQAVVGGTTVGKVNMWDFVCGKMPSLPIPNHGRVLAIAAHDTGEAGGYRLRLATATFPRQSKPVCIIWEALRDPGPHFFAIAIRI